MLGTWPTLASIFAFITGVSPSVPIEGVARATDDEHDEQMCNYRYRAVIETADQHIPDQAIPSNARKHRPSVIIQ